MPLLSRRCCKPQHVQGACCWTLQGNGNGSAEVEYYSKNFEFLSLGVMAYVGSDQAVTQLEAGKVRACTLLVG